MAFASFHTVTRAVAIALAAAPAWAATEASQPPADRLRTLCSQCHADGAAEGGLAIDDVLSRAAADGASKHPGDAGGGDHAAWLAIWKNLRAGTMPPAGGRRHARKPTTP